MYQANFKYSQRLNSFLEEFDALEVKISQKNQLLLPLKLQLKQLSLLYAGRLRNLTIDQTIIGKILREELVDEKYRYLLNYKKGLEFVDDLITKKQSTYIKKEQKTIFSYQPQLIIKIHQLLNNIPIYKQDNTQYRIKNLLLVNQLGFTYKPPTSLRLPILIKQYFKWLNKQVNLHPLIKSGLSHYIILAIYPFDNLNQETSCLLSRLILVQEKPSLNNIFSIERAIYNHQPEYYSTLNRTLESSPKIENQRLTGWLEFFSQIINQDIKTSLTSLSPKATHKPTPRPQETQVPFPTTSIWQQLTPRQFELLKYLKAKKVIKMKEAKKVFPDISEDSILRDLQKLQKHGLIIKKGKTKGAYYQII